MKTIHAVYEQGVFRPTERIDLPDGTPVEVSVPQKDATTLASSDEGLDRIYEVFDRRFRSGHHDTAARHDEHQP